MGKNRRDQSLNNGWRGRTKRESGAEKGRGMGAGRTLKEWEVRRAGAQKLTPGCAVGGHCVGEGKKFTLGRGVTHRKKSRQVETTIAIGNLKVFRQEVEGTHQWGGERGLCRKKRSRQNMRIARNNHNG